MVKDDGTVRTYCIYAAPTRCSPTSTRSRSGSMIDVVMRSPATSRRAIFRRRGPAPESAVGGRWTTGRSTTCEVCLVGDGKSPTQLRRRSGSFSGGERAPRGRTRRQRLRPAPPGKLRGGRCSSGPRGRFGRPRANVARVVVPPRPNSDVVLDNVANWACRPVGGPAAAWS